MVAEIWASVISSFVDQLVALTRAVLRLVWPFDGFVQNTYIRD